MCVADVVGHGEAVASVSREMHALLRRFMNQPDQRRVLADLNRRVQQMGLGAMTTAAAFSYYPTTRRLSFSYAGHPPAWFFCGTHRHWLRLDGPQSRAAPDCPLDMPLGIDGRTRYSTGSIEIHPGDRLLILTDGVLEVPDAQGDLFGEARLEQLLQQYESESCDGLAGALRAELAAHAGRSELDHDDVTFLAIEFTEAPRGPAAWQAVKNRLLRRRGTVGVVAR
jgi:sigma-B regulation protein RsbU (phosphoserine phosphatase)